MAEFQEVMKQRERMCENVHGNCSRCDIGKLANEKDLYCHNIMLDYYKESEKIIMDWAEEHPIKTNADKFKEVFGFIPDSEYCPNKCPENGCANCEYRHFWSQEYKEPKGE